MFEVDGVPPVAARVSGADQHDSWSSVVFLALGCTVTVALLLFGSLWLVYHYCVKMDEATRILHDIIERMEAGEILINGEPVEQLEDPVDHPIWYIRTQGLQQWAVDSISVVKYKEAEGLVEGADCAICLSEFEEDESLRLLPKCAHAFHVPCIDQWFRSNKNCPLCRTLITRTLITHVNGRPVFSMDAVHEAIRRSQVEWESRSVLVRQQPVEMVTGYADTSESDSDSDSSENGSNGFIADKNSSYSGSRKVKAESDPAENQRVPDKELTQVHGTLADTNIAVDLDASPDPNSPPAQKMKANWSGGTLGKGNSSDNDQARTRGMAKKRAASYGSKPSSAKSGSSESRVESDGM